MVMDTCEAWNDDQKLLSFFACHFKDNTVKTFVRHHYMSSVRHIVVKYVCNFRQTVNCAR